MPLSPCPSAPPTALLDARHLGRIDPTSQAPLLVPTDFALYPGDRVAITGPSGSGKSVLLRLLALLDAPSSGEVRWHGQPVTTQSVRQYRASVCYLAQRAALVEGSVRDNLQLPFRLKVRHGRHFDLDTVQLWLERAGKPPGFLDKIADELSGGEAQIVALLRTLQLAPDVILLDEPTSALDPDSAARVEQLVLDWFAEPGHDRAFAWVSHDPAQARRMGARHLRMHQGCLDGEPRP